jgi:hypothetical protein
MFERLSGEAGEVGEVGEVGVYSFTFLPVHSSSKTEVKFIK